MKRTLLISIAIAACACSRNAPPSQTQDNASTPQPGSAATAGGSAAAATGSQAVTLVGCLQGTAGPNATGTSGTATDDRARARATGKTADDLQARSGAANQRFTLANVTVESGGTGANGAGASGGPLIGEGSSVELDAVPADAQASVNTQVRVTGRLATTMMPTGTAPAEPAAGKSTAASPSGSSATARDDVRANSTTVASGDGAGGVTRHLTVETIQTIAQSCPSR
jgi:hypothetical protein